MANFQEIGNAFIRLRQQQRNQTQGRQSPLGNADPSYIKLLVQGQPNWRPANMSPANPVMSNPDVVAKVSGASGGATLSTSTGLEKSISLTITDGLCKGIKKPMKLPLPGGNSGRISIDPCKQEQDLENPVQVTLNTSATSGTTARAETELFVYSGKFGATVKPEGSMLFNGAEMEIQGVIDLLKNQGDSSVAAFFKRGGEYVFKMEGDLEYKVERQHRHTWTNQ